MTTVAALSLALAGAADSDPRFARVDRVVEEAMADNDVFGVGLAIIDDLEVVYQASYGFAEPGRSISGETLFQAASLSKPAAAMVLAAAGEEGLVDLEADVADMLRSWRLSPVPADGTVTIRLLLAHRAGVNVHGFPGYQIGEPLPELPRILSGVLNKNERIRVETEPGTQWQYSGGGYVMAQLAVEDHTGIEFEQLAEEYVFDPLGIELSTYRILEPAQRDMVAVGYRADGSEVAGGGWHLYPETAPASLWTTPTEYSRLVIDVMRSFTDDTGVVLDRDTAQSLLDRDIPVGFGVIQEQGGIVITHDGANEGYRASFLALPHLGQGVVVMTNSDAGGAVYEAAIDAVAVEFGWPGTGWSTPLWLAILALFALGGLAAWLVRRSVRRRRPMLQP